MHKEYWGNEYTYQYMFTQTIFQIYAIFCAKRERREIKFYDEYSFHFEIYVESSILFIFSIRTTLTSQYDGQPATNGHPSWPPDQTWRSNNSSECQSSSLHGNGSATAAVTTFAPAHPNGSLRSVLGKNQYLQPHHSGVTTSPAYWLLEAYGALTYLLTFILSLSMEDPPFLYVNYQP